MSITKVAHRYAEALADAAIARNQLDLVEEELRQFAELMNRSPELRQTLASPIVSPSDKGRVLDAIIAHTQPSRLTQNLLSLLLKHYRLHHLEIIYEQFKREVNKRRGIAVAQVATAVSFGGREQDRLRSKLESMVGATVQLQFKTDPALIGGVVTQIGSVVYDGSIRRQLEEIKQKLKQAEVD